MEQLFGPTSYCSRKVWSSILFFSTKDQVILYQARSFRVTEYWVCNDCSCLIGKIYWQQFFFCETKGMTDGTGGKVSVGGYKREKE